MRGSRIDSMVWTLLAISTLLWSGCETFIDVTGPPEIQDDDAGDDDAGDDDVSDDDTASDDDVDDLPSDDDTASDLLDLVVTYTWSDEWSCNSIHAGNMVDTDGDGVISPGDPKQLWVWTDPQQNNPQETMLVGHDGALHATILPDARMMWGTIGEVEPVHPGMEYLVAHYYSGEHQDWISLFAADGSPIWTQSFAENSTGRPWLTDLEGDGQLEAISGQHIIDAHSGASLGTIEGYPTGDIAWSIAADLDLDGSREIITMTTYSPQEVRLHDASGVWENTCWTGYWNWAVPAFAVGDLDGDPGGEFVVATTGWIVTCDSDGSLIAEAQFVAAQPSMTGLGQLDEDPLPEIVVADAYGITAFDTDLTELWTYDGTPESWNNSTWHPLTLVDLDGDGYHEVLTRIAERLVLLDRHGVEVATLEGQSLCSSWISAPAVTDIDGDGLAEIIVSAWPGFAIVENPYGGWLVDGADEPWPDIDKHPGDRTLWGGIPDPLDVHWADPRTNVWQGLPPLP